MATFRKNKKKDWFSYKAGLVIVHDIVFKDGSRNSATFDGEMELFATITNGRVKSDENGKALKPSTTISCFVDIFLHFSKMPITLFH